MLKVGITGNIASGKSEVEKILITKNYSVLDTDEVSHNLLLNKDIKTEIISTFKVYDVLDGEELSRQKLGQLVFANESLRQKLENILHPQIIKEVKHFFVEKETAGERIVFVSVPLLFEAKFENIFDKIILIYSDDNIRLERLIKRNELPLEYAQNRLKIQISQDEKISLADYVIYNNKSLADLKNNVEDIIKLL